MSVTNLCHAIAVLVPAARPPLDYDIADGRIVRWNAAKLGAQPTPEALAAVTQAQVDAMFAARAAALVTPERSALAAALDQALADNATYLAIATPTNAQNAAQLRRLTQQMQAVLRRLAQVT